MICSASTKRICRTSHSRLFVHDAVRYGYRRFLWLALFLLTGCSLGAYHKDEAHPGLKTIPCQHELALEGRFSIRYIKNDLPEFVQGKFSLKQTREKDILHVLSPLGQGIAQIEVMPGMALLNIAGKPPKYAGSAEELLMNELGLPLPVSGLRNWLQGCAVSREGSAFQASPEKNTVQTREGWQITYVSWKKVDAAAVRPLRMDMQYRGDMPLHSLTIRIILDSWQ